MVITIIHWNEFRHTRIVLDIEYVIILSSRKVLITREMFFIATSNDIAKFLPG